MMTVIIVVIINSRQPKERCWDLLLPATVMHNMHKSSYNNCGLTLGFRGLGFRFILFEQKLLKAHHSNSKGDWECSS